MSFLFLIINHFTTINAAAKCTTTPSSAIIKRICRFVKSFCFHEMSKCFGAISFILYRMTERTRHWQLNLCHSHTSGIPLLYIGIPADDGCAFRTACASLRVKDLRLITLSADDPLSRTPFHRFRRKYLDTASVWKTAQRFLP